MDHSMLYPLQLLDVRLFEANVERLSLDNITDDILPESQTAELPPVATPFLKADRRIVRHEDRHKVTVFLSLEIKGPSAEHPEFHLQFTLEGLFDVLVDFADIEAEAWQEFEQTSSMTLLWPYAREYTHSFSRRMRADLPILPTLNRLAMLKMVQQSKMTEVEETDG